MGIVSSKIQKWQGSGFAVGTGESILVMGAAADRRGGVLLFGCFGM
jgi:hypothetical protein